MSLLEEFKKLNKVCQKPDYKKTGNWMVRNIIREACIPATYFLLKTPVTANQVTFFALLLGIAGCILFLITTKLSFLWLSIFLHLSYYFDHVDGQIARCKKQVSLSGLMFDFISHYIIFGTIFVSLGLKAYFENGCLFCLYCGIVGSLSIISFNLLVESKYRAFFIELLKHNEIEIKKPSSDKKDKINIPAKFFSLIHKTCEMHIIINTITVVAILQFFGLKGMPIFSVNPVRYLLSNGVNITLAGILAVYYGLASFMLAAVKTYFFVTAKRVDAEFKDIFSVKG